MMLRQKILENIIQVRIFYLKKIATNKYSV